MALPSLVLDAILWALGQGGHAGDVTGWVAAALVQALSQVIGFPAAEPPPTSQGRAGGQAKRDLRHCVWRERWIGLAEAGGQESKTWQILLPKSKHGAFGS